MHVFLVCLCVCVCAEEFKADIRRLGGVGRMVHLLLEDDPAVQENGALLIGSLAADGASVFLHSLCWTCVRNSSSASWLTVRLCACADDAMKAEIQAAGAVPALCELLNVEDGDTQRYAALALGNCCTASALTPDALATTDKVKDEVRACGGCACWYGPASMRCGSVCLVLLTYVRCPEGVSARVLTEGGIDVLTQLLGVPAHDVLAAAALALANCAHSADCAEAALTHNAVQGLAALLAAEDDALVQPVTQALANIAAAGPHAAELMRRLGVLRAAVGLLAGTGGTRDVGRAACVLLANSAVTGASASCCSGTVCILC